MIHFTKTSKPTKQRYSEFTKLTNNQLNVIRGGETPPEKEKEAEAAGDVK